MKKIPKTNYLYVVILLLMTTLITLTLSNIYISKNKFTSDFYEYSNKINGEEFFEFSLENPDSIIYISDKYDLSHAKFENKLKNKIDSLNLKDKFVYIDKDSLSKKTIKNIEEEYTVKIDYNKKPIILFIIDKKLIKIQEIQLDTDVNTLINYEVFE